MIKTSASFSLSVIGIVLLVTLGSYWPAIVIAVLCFIGASVVISGAEFPQEHKG